MQRISFPLPPNLNQIINQARTNRYKSAGIKKQWTNKIAAIADRDLEPIEGKVWVAVESSFARSNSDPDNALASILKFGLDGLVKAGILEGDSIKTISSPILYSYYKEKTKTATIILFSDRTLYAKYLTNQIDRLNTADRT